MKKKQMPFAPYNVLLCLLAAAIFVLGSLCLQAAEEKWYLKIDLSEDRISDLSDYTRAHLDALQEDVTLHLVHSPGSSTLYDLQQETLLKLAAVCPRVHVQIIDPNAQPHLLLALAGDTQGVDEGIVFVQNESATRTVRIPPEDFLFSRRIGEEQYTIYCGEAMLIGGIDRAVDEDPAAVWFVTGHGEADENALAQLMLQCRAMGLEVRSGALALMSPKAGDVLALIGPQSDLTAAEADALKSCLNNGVHLLTACGADTPVARLTELNALLDLYGLTYRSGWAVENAAETAFFVDSPALLSPALSGGLSWLEELPGRLILPRACALGEPALRPGVTAKTLLSTSSRAILKMDPNAADLTAAPGDLSGTLPLAILAETGESCILQLGSAQMLLTGEQADGAYVLDASENLAFLAACLERMTDQGGGATLDAGVKQLATQLITFDSQAQRQQVSALLLGLWPVLIGVVMIAVLIRRRRL